MLIEVAATQKHKVSPADLREIHDREFPGSPDTWLEHSISEMEKREWAKDGRKVGRSDLFVTGTGLAQAELLRNKYRERNLIERISGLNWTMLGVVVAAIAVVAYLIVELGK